MIRALLYTLAASVTLTLLAACGGEVDPLDDAGGVGPGDAHIVSDGNSDAAFEAAYQGQWCDTDLGIVDSGPSDVVGTSIRFCSADPLGPTYCRWQPVGDPAPPSDGYWRCCSDGESFFDGGPAYIACCPGRGPTYCDGIGPKK